jgi:proteasome chaperone 2
VVSGGQIEINFSGELKGKERKEKKRKAAQPRAMGGTRGGTSSDASVESFYHRELSYRRLANAQPFNLAHLSMGFASGAQHQTQIETEAPAIQATTAITMATATTVPQKTVVVPLVGMANVPQYAAQLAIDAHRSQLTKRHVYSRYLYPFLGGDLTVKERMDGKTRDDDDSNAVFAYPWEVYTAQENSVGIPNIMQFRSPIVPGCESLFVKQLIQEIKEGQYERIIVLDSKDRGLWHGEAEAGADGRDEGEVMQWHSVALRDLTVDDSTNTGNTEKMCTLQSIEETSPVVRLLVDQLNGLEVSVNYAAVAVYEGWNWPAVEALQRQAGLTDTTTRGYGLGVGRREQQWTPDVYV